MTSGGSARDRATAVREIRSAEASRILGLPDAGTLSTMAEQWMRAGLDSANLRALAGASTSGANPTDQILGELLAGVAREQGIMFATLQEARSVHAERVVTLIGRPEEFGAQLFGLSNTVTDEIVARVRRLFARPRNQHDEHRPD